MVTVPPLSGLSGSSLRLLTLSPLSASSLSLCILTLLFLPPLSSLCLLYRSLLSAYSLCLLSMFSFLFSLPIGHGSRIQHNNHVQAFALCSISQYHHKNLESIITTTVFNH